MCAKERQEPVPFETGLTRTIYPARLAWGKAHTVDLLINP